jgi:hypothetical protein
MINRQNPTINRSSSRVADEIHAGFLKAIVIFPNEKTTDLGCLLAIARKEACRREHVSVNPTVRALVFVAEVGVYVAVYEAPNTQLKEKESVP